MPHPSPLMIMSVNTVDPWTYEGDTCRNTHRERFSQRQCSDKCAASSHIQTRMGMLYLSEGSEGTKNVQQCNRMKMMADMGRADRMKKKCIGFRQQDIAVTALLLDHWENNVINMPAQCFDEVITPTRRLFLYLWHTYVAYCQIFSKSQWEFQNMCPATLSLWFLTISVHHQLFK